MPYLEIKLANIIFDSKVQTYCINPNFECPSYGHSWACPPEAPFLEKELSKYQKFFLIYVKFNLKKHVQKIKADHPKRSEQHIRNAFFMKNFLRDKLEQEIFNFIDRNQIPYKSKLILWDGFCRICYNQIDQGCTYDSGNPCRYPNKIRYSMEAVGIDVTKTVKPMNFNLEWPPTNYVYRFGLVCFK